VDPALGMSYIQFAMEGLRHQLSQGAGGWSVEPGDRFTFYKLVDSVKPPQLDKNGHERDFFDGIDTSLPGIVDRTTGDLAAKAKTADWRRELTGVQQDIAKATGAADRGPSAAVAPLQSAMISLRRLVDGMVVGDAVFGSSNGEYKTELPKERLPRGNSQLTNTEGVPRFPSAKELLTALTTKETQLQRAINLAAGVELHLTLDSPADDDADGAVVAPGQTFKLRADFAGPADAKLQKIGLDLPKGWTFKEVRPSATGNTHSTVSFEVTVPRDAQYTRPYWHRANPETDSINAIDDARYVTLPFPPPPVRGKATYTLGGNGEQVEAAGLWKGKGASGQEEERAIAVVPAFSVTLEPGTQVIATEASPQRSVKVGVSYDALGPAKGMVRLEVPAGWRAAPSELPVEFLHRGEKRDFEFKVFPASLKEGRTEIRAVLEAGGQKYSEGYSLVTREDLNSFYYYQPAAQRVSMVDVKVPEKLKVAYIMGAGDDIPTSLTQIGIDTTVLPAEKLAGEDLGKYGTVVLGIRAYDTQKEIAANNKKLLDYVASGGTLVVQYNAGVGDFNSGHFTPYPAQLSRTRVSVEEAPVEILAPDDSVFHYPNEITQRDFDGWVQERGLNFMDQWDDHFKPLLASHDPGEPEQKGGMLRAQYGKGTYIYTGYAFFRQLPAGVPGAIRLFVNILSAGHEAGR
jgi:hypothetical protein